MAATANPRVSPDSSTRWDAVLYTTTHPARIRSPSHYCPEHLPRFNVICFLHFRCLHFISTPPTQLVWPDVAHLSYYLAGHRPLEDQPSLSRSIREHRPVFFHRATSSMAIREKARALFKTRSKSDRDSQLSKTSTQNSDRERWPSNVYKPGETMPRPKYRAPPKKEHKEKLEAFSFAEAWRRKSFQSQHSPMGTRAPSRRNSGRDSRRTSWISIGRKSFSGKSESRTNSITSGETEKSGVRQREHLGVARPPALQQQIEQEGDDDVSNGERLLALSA